MKEHRKSFVGLLALRLPLIATALILLTIFAIVGNFLITGVPHLSWSFFTDPPTHANTEGGIYPAIVGTVALVLLMTLAAVPVGTTTVSVIVSTCPAGAVSRPQKNPNQGSGTDWGSCRNCS